MNKWRYVEYLDDGHCRYQCLACKADIICAGLDGWKFCPWCGTEWEGQHECRDHNTPRWAHDRGIRDWWDGWPAWEEDPQTVVMVQYLEWEGQPWKYETYFKHPKHRLGWWKVARSYLETCRLRAGGRSNLEGEEYGDDYPYRYKVLPPGAPVPRGA